MVGGIDNVKLSPLNTHKMVLLANYLACILCCSIEDQALAIREEHLGGLIDWYLINNVEGKKALSHKSYLLNRYGRLSINIKQIIQLVIGKNGCNDRMAKFVLVRCLEKTKEVEKLLPNIK